MKKTKRLLSMALALVMALCTLSAGLVVQAADTAKILPTTLWAGQPEYQDLMFQFPEMEDEYNAKLLSIKSSNTKVLKARKDGNSMWDAQVLPLKAGKSKVTVTYKLNGKETSISKTLSVQKAPHPFQWIKVGGKKVDVSKADYECDILNWTKTSAKVEWKLKKGWRADQVIFYNSKDKNGNFKSGSSLSVPKNGYAYLDLSLTNQDGDGFSYKLWVMNGKPKLEKDTLWLGIKDAAFPLSIKNLPYNAKVVSLKSSNKKVIKVKKGNTLSECSLQPKKAGKSKITLSVAINGKKKTYSATYTVKKYPTNAFKWMKVDGKAVNLKKNKFVLQYKATKDATKLSWKLGKGWKVKSCQNIFTGENIKSGDMVKTPSHEEGSSGSVAWVQFTLTNKSKDLFEYHVTFDR